MSIPKPLSEGEAILEQHLKCYAVGYEREYRFDPNRKWRADFFIAPNILVEVEGGHWVGGRHSRGGTAFEADAEKYNRATEMGFRILRYTTQQVHRGETIDQLLRMLQ